MSVRWDNSFLGKLEQHTLGRAEALGKTILYTGLTVAQITKIAVKTLMSLGTGGGFSETNPSGYESGNEASTRISNAQPQSQRRINQFSVESLAKDWVILAGFASSIFTKGVAGVIFAPKSTSRSLGTSAGAAGRLFLNAVGKGCKGGIYNDGISLSRFISFAKPTLPNISFKSFKASIFG